LPAFSHSIATGRVVVAEPDALLRIVKLPYTFRTHSHIQNRVIFERHYLPNRPHQQMNFGGNAIPARSGHKSARGFTAYLYAKNLPLTVEGLGE
jgi:hypothetical protein